jgi:hypothetical protein
VERNVVACGLALPVPQRARWLEIDGASDTLLLVAEDPASNPLSAVGVGIHSSRALPLHRRYRVERMGAASPAGDAGCLATIAQIAREDARCLGVSIEVFERDARERDRLRRDMAAVGFVQSSALRMYARTLALELSGTEAELFAGLNSSARRNVRAPAKKGLELRPITDPALSTRIAQLMRHSFERTGASPNKRKWDRIIEMSARNPALSRIVGLFDPHTPGADSLVSVAWGCAHGAYASYEEGAAIRRPDLGNLALGYAPLWDLIMGSPRNGGELVRSGRGRDRCRERHQGRDPQVQGVFLRQRGRRRGGMALRAAPSAERRRARHLRVEGLGGRIARGDPQRLTQRGSTWPDVPAVAAANARPGSLRRGAMRSFRSRHGFSITRQETIAARIESADRQAR